MSSPTSVKLAPPLYVDPRVRRRSFFGYLIQIWISLIPGSYLLYWFFYDYILEFSHFSTGEMHFSFKNWIEQYWLMPSYVLFLIIPIIILFIYIITVIWTALITKMILIWLKILRRPKEGVFYRSLKDKDYVYWNKRNFAKMFLFWLLHSIPLPFLKKFFTFNFLDVRIGKNSVVNDCWISSEFVKIGKNVTLGQSVCIYSFQFQGDKLLVAKVDISDEVFIGPQVVIFPGTKIQKGVEIDGGSFSHPFTEYEENGVYHGTPVKLIRTKKE